MPSNQIPSVITFHIIKLNLAVWIVCDDTGTIVEIYCEDYQELLCTTKLAPELHGPPSKHVVLLLTVLSNAYVVALIS